MLESIIVLSVAGLFAGIIFSVPAAGPITILIVSNALRGKKRYCHRVAFGAAVADLLYTFIAVYAFSNLYKYYEPYIPYIGLGAAVLLVFIGLRMRKIRIDYEHMDDEGLIRSKLKNKGGFRTGMMINLLNPALFAGWLISSFLVITLAASLGFRTGGLNAQLNETIQKMENGSVAQSIENNRSALENLIENMNGGNGAQNRNQFHKVSPGQLFFSSLLFAVMVTIGSTIWFYGLGNFMISRRKWFKPGIMNKVINGLGYVLLLLSIYLAYSSIFDFFT